MGFNPGDRIGNYRVDSELGASGAGLLIQAQHLVLPRRVLLKVVHPAFAAIQPYAVQTLREACILEAIAHPGVPVVYESGVLRDRRPWFALEVIAGPTLEDALAAGPLATEDAIHLVRDLAEILEHAHRRGVIHRGLRPDRVVITAARRYPLCIPDWSEAIVHDATSHLLPATPEHAYPYIAPELAHELERSPDPVPEGSGPHASHAFPMSSGAAIDDRADMFALGAIGYRALTGELAFADGTYVAVRDRVADAPDELASLIDALLAFDRFDRPNAGEVHAVLEAMLPHGAPAVQQHAAAQFTMQRGKVDVDAGPHGDAAPVSSTRLRRPRWTPDIRYLETTHVDITLAAVEEDWIKD
ncbi:MAG TPA: serine/threonine-protein kinase [Kofleriaceae bacterium]|nr:serine/threonine-protein kinase [Kofleriaceae bacterium]